MAHSEQALNEVRDFLQAAYRWRLEDKFMELLAMAAAPLPEDRLYDLTLAFCDQAQAKKPADFLAALKQESLHLARQNSPMPVPMPTQDKQGPYHLAQLVRRVRQLRQQRRRWDSPEIQDLPEWWAEQCRRPIEPSVLEGFDRSPSDVIAEFTGDLTDA
jgi:hypothetical protein